jgi:hypothetical protein
MLHDSKLCLRQKHLANGWADALTDITCPAYFVLQSCQRKVPVNEVERALSQIADIHAQFAANTRFRGIAPEANVMTCMLSLAVAAAQTIWPHALAQDPLRYITIWVAVSIASIVIISIEAISRSRRLHGEMADAMLGSAWRQTLPFGAAAAIVTAVICKFSPASAWMLPGLWQILIGLLGFSVMSSLPRAMIWVAGWYFLCGAFVLGLAGSSGTLSPWMMGIPFVAGQAAVALIFHRAGGRV